MDAFAAKVKYKRKMSIDEWMNQLINYSVYVFIYEIIHEPITTFSLDITKWTSYTAIQSGGYVTQHSVCSYTHTHTKHLYKMQNYGLHLFIILGFVLLRDCCSGSSCSSSLVITIINPFSSAKLISPSCLGSSSPSVSFLCVELCWLTSSEK